MQKQWNLLYRSKYFLCLVFLGIILISVVFLVVPKNLFSGLAPHPAPVTLPPQWSEYDPVLGTMILQINESEIYRTTYDMQNFSTRQFPSSGNDEAAQYLYSRLSLIPGLDVTYQDPEKQNIIASLPGKDLASRKVIIVGAHYDSGSSDPFHAPGATDNGCGVATVLELARVMSTHTYNHTLVFAFWNAEETPDSRGSTGYVTYARENSLDIPLYFNYDSSCYDPDNQKILDIMYDRQSEPFAELLTCYNTVYSINFTLTGNANECDGDHIPFRQGGYPAIMTHSGLHADEAHTPEDTVDLISTEYAGKNAQLGMLILSRAAGIQS
jgi:hypothetical protein